MAARLAIVTACIALAVAFCSAASASDCPDGVAPTATDDVVATVQIIEEALARADSARFASAQHDLAEQVACLEELLPRSTVAAVHRMRGLLAFTERDPEEARTAFAAARALAPDYALPADLLPAGHPIRAAYDEASPTSAATEAVPPPLTGNAWIDGRIAAERPVGRSALLQLVGDDGRVRHTAYLAVDAPLPPYAIRAGGPGDRGDEGGPSRPRTAWLVGGGAAALVAGGLYATAATRRAAWTDAPVEDKARMRQQTNTLAAISGVAAASAVGFGVVAIVDGGPGIRLRW